MSGHQRSFTRVVKALIRVLAGPASWPRHCCTTRLHNRQAAPATSVCWQEAREAPGGAQSGPTNLDRRCARRGAPLLTCQQAGPVGSCCCCNASAMAGSTDACSSRRVAVSAQARRRRSLRRRTANMRRACSCRRGSNGAAAPIDRADATCPRGWRAAPAVPWLLLELLLVLLVLFVVVLLLESLPRRWLRATCSSCTARHLCCCSRVWHSQQGAGSGGCAANSII